MSYDYNRQSGPIPNRWLTCPRKSATLIGGMFLALKTPLMEKFNVPDGSQFTPQMFFEMMNSHKVKIGLWIDLTNTSRFYDPATIRKNGAKYTKIHCRGHEDCPTQDQVSDFIRAVHNFIRDNPLEIIAVHCTHGFNRTGFMIASYLTTKSEWSIDKALAAFSQSRPPGIYKQDYIDELFVRFDDADASPRAPPLPEWCFSESDDNDYNNCDNNSKQRREPMVRNGKMKTGVFMEGVPGVELVTDSRVSFAVLKRIQETCGWMRKGFPGCQPVSMTVDNLKFLSKNQYKVSWKADGTRYMMFIDDEPNKMYFADRDFCLFQMSGLTFPDKFNLNKSICNTLLDGEMVIDTDAKGTKTPRYLIYDAIRIQGKDVMNDNFHLRFERINTDIIRPRTAAIEKGIINRKREPFSIRRKDFWPADAATTAKLLSESFKNQLLHEPDGLILQPEQAPYIAGVSNEVLKWKPASHNSVDFKVKIVTRRQEGMPIISTAELYVGACNLPFSSMKATRSIKEQDGKIIECRYDNNQWVFMRVRTDKSFPNSFDTANAVCASIGNPVTEQILLDYLHSYGYRRSDKELMPPPPKRRRV